MRRVLFAFILLFVAIIVGIQLNEDPGYVLVAINHWTIETTLWIGVFAMVLLFIALYCILKVCQHLFKAPKTFHRWRRKKRVKKAQAITQRGLIEYNEGHWDQAKNHLIQASSNVDMPFLNYLTAARAAQKMGDSHTRDAYLRQAKQTAPEATIAVELTQAELQLANHQWQEALITLKHLHDLAPYHPYVLTLMVRLYQEVRDWPQLIALFPLLKKNQVMSTDALESLQLTTYQQALQDLSKQNQIKESTQLFLSIPKVLRSNPEIVATYTRLLLASNDPQQAQALLQRCLTRAFDPKLIDLYGLLPANDKQLPFAEYLLKKNAEEASLQLCLGRLCMDKQLWGKAKTYLEKANQLHPTPATYKALGNLHVQLNEPLQACENFKKGLELATQNT
jgi:HemY protein